MIIQGVTNQDDASAETIPTRGHVQQQTKIDHGNDIAAIAEQPGQKCRCMRYRAELNSGHELDNARHINGIAIWTNRESQKQHE